MFKIIRRILVFARDYRKRIYLAFVFSFLKSLLMCAPIVMGAMVISWLIDGTMTIMQCCLMALGLLGVLALQAVLRYLSDYFQSSAGYELFATKRVELGEHLRRLPMGFFAAGNIGNISSVLSADMVFIEENCMMILADMMSDIFTQIILTIFMFVINPLLGLVVLAVELTTVLVAHLAAKVALVDSRIRQQAFEDMSSSVIEYTEGIGIVKSFGMSGKHAERLRSSFTTMADASLKFENDYAPWQRIIYIVFGIGTAAALGVCLWLHQTEALSLASAIAVLLFLFSLFNPLRHLYDQNVTMTILQAALDRFEKLMAEPELADIGTSRFSETAENEIEFRDVTFAYEGTDVLSNVSFEVKRGELCALVGPSGSGKTTVANLLSRFWDISSGQILVRGTDIREVPLAELMSTISMVFQRVYLFRDTIYHNILTGRGDATPEEVYEAARRAQCYDFIMELPYGFDTTIGEGGATLSGGEAQRVSIARCILKDAPIVVLDEATASVDADNESAIQQAISELCQGKTLLTIAHRLGTIRDASEILLIEDGVIAEQGTFDELMQLQGHFERMVSMQGQVISWTQDESGERECA